jgi:DNA-binding response OmpR family regulator
VSEPEPNLDTVGPETEYQHQARLVEPKTEASLVSDGNPARATATVLVVEDEGPVRELILDVLRLQGYQVLEAQSGEEALAVAERHGGPIHLIVLDVVLPGVTAPDIVRRLRASRPALRALYISGYTGDQIGQHGLMQVGRDFLQKPFSVDALVLKVREALDGD